MTIKKCIFFNELKQQIVLEDDADQADKKYKQVNKEEDKKAQENIYWQGGIFWKVESDFENSDRETRIKFQLARRQRRMTAKKKENKQEESIKESELQNNLIMLNEDEDKDFAIAQEINAALKSSSNTQRKKLSLQPILLKKWKEKALSAGVEAAVIKSSLLDYALKYEKEKGSATANTDDIHKDVSTFQQSSNKGVLRYWFAVLKSVPVLDVLNAASSASKRLLSDGMVVLKQDLNNYVQWENGGSPQITKVDQFYKYNKYYDLFECNEKFTLTITSQNKEIAKNEIANQLATIKSVCAKRIDQIVKSGKAYVQAEVQSRFSNDKKMFNEATRLIAQMVESPSSFGGYNNIRGELKKMANMSTLQFLNTYGRDGLISALLIKGILNLTMRDRKAIDLGGTKLKQTQQVQKKTDIQNFIYKKRKLASDKTNTQSNQTAKQNAQSPTPF